MATEITWLGHNAWAIQAGEHRLLLDPFLNDNPLSPKKADQVEADFILVSHGHGDHVGDTVVPIHNGTWPIIAQGADGWARRVRAETGAEPIVLQPGGTILL